MTRLRLAIAALALLLVTPLTHAQCVSLTTLGSSYSQTFDTLSNTASSTTNNLTLTGWFMTETGGGARDNEQYAVDTGGSTTGDTYSYGEAGNTDRAFGGLRSGTLQPVVGACFTNNTGATLTSLDLNYYGEEWRLGALSRTDRVDFQYSTDATSLATGIWNDHNALDFVTPNTATTGAQNGNATANRTNLVSSIPTLSIANGATFWIRWVDADAAGADDGLAVDDFFLTPQGAVPPPTLTISDVSQSEGNAGSTTFTFTVNLSSPAPTGGVTFDIATADNTAASPADYTQQSLTGQTIPAGSSTYDFDVTVLGDTSVESNETFFVNVTNIVNAVAGDAQGTGTILNDDSPTLSIDDVTQSEGTAGTSIFTFTVSLTQPAGPGGVTFDIATADSTATAGSDYVQKSLTGETIAAGNSTYTFDVVVNGDNDVEPTETFFVNVSNITGGVAGDAQGTGTITTDEPNLSIANVTAAEGNSGTTNFTFTVSLDIPAPASGVTFDVATSPGTATAGTDYVHQTLTGQMIPAASSTYTFTVAVNGDALFEANETFFVDVTNVSAGVGVTDGQAQGTITNDDTAPAFSISDAVVIEGDAATQTATFTVSLSGTRDTSIDVNVATADASATIADNDYVANATTLTFAPGDATKTFDVTVNGDTNSEGNEQFLVVLSGATGGATISDAQGLGIVRMDDPMSIAAIDTEYLENFDVLAQTAAATTPVGWTQQESAANANATYAAGTGSSTAGDTWSFGVAGTNPIGDRAFGGLLSGSLVPTIGAFYRNDSATTITSLSIQYSGEEWRLGSAGRADRLDFQYSLDATALNDGTWTHVDQLDFSTPNQTGTGLKDGNAAANRARVVHTIDGLSIAPGSTFWIRFTDFNASGSDDGLAVDDFSIIANYAGAFLSIDDVQQFEQNAGTTTYTFTVSLTQPAPPGGVTFDIATQDGTATAADADYVATSLTGQTIAAGNTSYTFDVTVNGDTTIEASEQFSVVVTNLAGALPADTTGIGMIVDDDSPITPIHDIQGPGTTSPIPGANVTFNGIVTGVKSNGFFVQEEDADADADPATSEGVYVFTGSSPAANVVLGANVLVAGTVVEYVPTADPQQPPMTEITSPSVVVLSSGNPLPAPVVLSNTFPDPAGPFDQLERVEAMRVQVDSLTVTGPTDGSFNEITGFTSSNGRFYGVVTGTPRPMREAGIQAPDTTPTGSIPPIPRWDFNPERLKVESNALGAGVLVVQSNDVVTSLVGPLDYGFRAYAILPDGTAPASVTPGVLPTTTTAPLSTEVTVASFNVNRLFNDVADGTGPTVDTTLYNARLGKASLAIRSNLNTPDVVGVQEVENLATLQDLAARISLDAVADSQPDPMYVAYLVEGNDVGGIDVGYLVKTGEVAAGLPRVTNITVTQELDGTTWIDPKSGNPATLHDRPPLVLDATVNHASGASYDITVVNNHLRSLLGMESEEPDGLTTEGDRVRRKRLAQAQDLANLIQSYQTADPARNVIVIGDFNAFEVNDGYVDVMNTIAGTPPPDDETVVPGDGIDLVNPDLDNLVDTPPAAERYSYVHEGNAQNIDHALVNQALIGSTTARRIEHPRIDADYPETERADVSNPLRVSDHDPVLAYFSPVVFVPSAIAIANASVVEGNAGTASLTFDVTLDVPSASAVTVDFATADATATAGSDYAAASGTVTFAPGDVAETITVTVNGDVTFEADETLTVTLSNNSGNSTIATAAATGTITNDDLPAAISIGDASVIEGNAGSTLTFTLVLDKAAAENATVSYTTVDGTATIADSDYTAATGTVTFVPGDLSETISITVTGDTIPEDDETLTVALSSPSANASLGDSSGLGTIVNDDPTLITIADASVVEGDAGTTTLSFTVSLSNPVSGTVTVDFATTDGTAIAGSDYAGASGTVTFLPGDISETVLVTVNGDPTFESDETMNVVLSTPSANASIVDGTAAGTIINDDGVSLVTIADASIVEGDAGTSTLTFNVTLNTAAAENVTVDFATSDGTATAGSDYAAATGTVTFTPGQTAQTVSVTVNGDVFFENDETLSVTLSSPSANAGIADGLAVGTITNDDGVSMISIADASIAEGDAGTSTLTFNVTLNIAAVENVTVDFATSDGTATAGSDYAAATGTVTFAPGETTQTITINVDGDTSMEADETLVVTLSTPSANAALADGVATGTITNDDGAVAALAVDMTITPAAPGVGEPITKTIVVTNAGPDAANNVVVTDDLQDGLTLVSVATTQGTCNNADPVSCQVGTLGAGESATITIVVQATLPGSYSNSVTVVSDENVAGETETDTFVVGAASIAAVPTLSEYALFALLGLLALIAVRRLS